ncbi:WhiB family transcriptional regulator [Mycobacterium kansasii]
MSVIGIITAITGQQWMADALCRQTDPEIFYPEQGGSPREAKLVCLACRVQTACLEHALRNHEQHGIWGGLTADERKHRGRTLAAQPLQLRCRNGHQLGSKADLGYGRNNCRQCARDNWQRYRARQAGGAVK